MSKWKIKAWKVATAVVVAIIIINPEVAGLALFIDAVGLEMFFMLLEVQILVVFGMFHAKLSMYFLYVKDLFSYLFSKKMWLNIKKKPENLQLLVPSQATMMSLLVCSAFVDILFRNIALVI